MNRKFRRHPRIPTNQICSLRRTMGDQHVNATTFCVATHGLGLWVVEPDREQYNEGDLVTVSLPVEGRLTDLRGLVAWAETANNATLNIGIRFAHDMAPPDSYVRWVGDKYIALRRESMAIGGELAFQRRISLRTYQDALDRQARDGGYLEEHLLQLVAE